MQVETKCHIACADYLREKSGRMPDKLFYWHTPNGGKRDKREAGLLKRMGVKAGFPDFGLMFRNKIAFVELKIEGETLRDSQEELRDTFARLGFESYHLIATNDPEDAKKQMQYIVDYYLAA